MKQECLTYLKTIRKSKTLAATLSDTEPEDDFDNEDDEILNAFTTIINPIEGIVEDVDEEKEFVESKFKKMDVELGREELSTKFDESNQTIRALRFENNFLAEKIKKLEAELFQVKA